jgi:hypothetical protein
MSYPSSHLASLPRPRARNRPINPEDADAALAVPS